MEKLQEAEQKVQILMQSTSSTEEEGPEEELKPFTAPDSPE